MKRFMIFLWLPLLLMSLWLPAAAELDLLRDEADLLSEQQEAEMEVLLAQMTDRNAFDVAVLIVEDYNANSLESYARTVFFRDGYGKKTYGGVLLALSMAERDWCCIVEQDPNRPMLTDDCLQQLEDEFLPFLKEDDFFGAIEQYAVTCDKLVTTMRLIGEYAYIPAMEWYYIPIAVGLGVIPAVLIVWVMASKLRTVQMQAGAKSYLVEDSLRITERSEHYLYNRVVRIPRAKQGNNGKFGGGVGGGSISRSGKF